MSVRHRQLPATPRPAHWPGLRRWSPALLSRSFRRHTLRRRSVQIQPRGRRPETFAGPNLLRVGLRPAQNGTPRKVANAPPHRYGLSFNRCEMRLPLLEVLLNGDRALHEVRVDRADVAVRAGLLEG